MAATVYTGGAAAGLFAGEAAAGSGALLAAESGIAAGGMGVAGATTATTAATGMTAIQTAGLYSSIAGAGLSAYGQAQAAQAAKDTAGYNQAVANIQKQDALDRGDLEQQQLGRKISALRGQQTANMAANGVDISSGSPREVLNQTDYYGLEDQRTVANNARREAAGYGSRATLAGMQADSYDPALTGGASLLSSAGAVADRWYRYNNGGRNYVSSIG